MSEEKRYLEYETSFSWTLAIGEIMKADQLSTVDLWNVEDEIREAG
ncbi:hypothetical protein C5S29_11725 [ANME-1 cluster archaeon GoMg3.2]|nr:hypothetical protein [ANME-1 cluster archaeon GoMg3.2]